MALVTPEGTSIKAICFCEEEKEIYFPCPDERLAMEQLEWLFRHLRDHNAVYFNAPFNLNVTVMDKEFTFETGGDLDPSFSPQGD